MNTRNEELQALASKLGTAKITEVGVPEEVFRLADITRTVMSQRLREIADDPMWADHCEIRKSTLLKAAREMEEAGAAVQYFMETRNMAIDKLVEAEEYIQKLQASLMRMQAGGVQ